MVQITHKYLKSVSTSDYKKIIEIIKNNINSDTEKACEMLELILDKLKEDEEFLKNGDI